jgi:tetratricopeptide (TPR) repeat protein
MDADSPPRCPVVGTPVSYGLELFKDRRAQREQIRGWLADPATRMVTVFGPRGIGKSALAAKVVEMLAGADGDCRGVVNLSTRTGGPLTIERIFFACAELAGSASKQGLDAVWASGREPQDKLIELFTAMGEGTHVVVLDNIEDQLTDAGQPKNPDLGLFLDAVFRAPRAPRVLVTSQVPISLDPAVRRFEARLYLKDGLPVADSVELLRELDRNGDAGLVAAAPGELEQAAKRLHGVPRALELTVGAMVEDHLTMPTLNDILSDFTARGDIVEQLAQDRYVRLDGEARLTLDVLAVFRSPVSREPVEWVLHPLAPGLDPARALSQLAQVHMISVNRSSREFALHPLDADIAYAALPMEGPIGQRVLERRVAAWYESRRCPPPWRSVTDVVNHRLEFDHRLRAGDYDECAGVLDQIGEFLITRGSVREVVGMHLAIGDHLHNDVGLLAHLVGYGRARHIGGPLEEAIQPLRQAVTLAERTGDKRQLARALLSLGDVFRALRRLHEAVEVLRRAADISKELGNSYYEGLALLVLSLSYTYLGQVPEALEFAAQLERLGRDSADPSILGQAGDARSAAYIVAERWDNAFSAAGQAIDGYTSAGIRDTLGYPGNVQGIARLGQGRIEEAVALLIRARTNGAAGESPRAEGLCLYNLAWAHWMASRYDAAENAARDAVEVFNRAGSADVAASKELARAAAAMFKGDEQTAREALTRGAEASRGNADLCPAGWLLAEADRLRERHTQ